MCPCRFTASVSLPHRSDEFSVQLLKALESALVDFALDEPDGALDNEDDAVVSSPISTYFKIQTADTDDEDDAPPPPAADVPPPAADVPPAANVPPAAAAAGDEEVEAEARPPRRTTNATPPAEPAVPKSRSGGRKRPAADIEPQEPPNRGGRPPKEPNAKLTKEVHPKPNPNPNPDPDPDPNPNPQP
jgi:hypothetical protein